VKRDDKGIITDAEFRSALTVNNYQHVEFLIPVDIKRRAEQLLMNLNSEEYSLIFVKSEHGLGAIMMYNIQKETLIEPEKKSANQTSDGIRQPADGLPKPSM
jgi:hypothetical protein